MATDTGWFDLTPVEMARALIGAPLTVGGVGGMVVETEAYDIDDEASHSFVGPTPRNAPMFGPPGRAYVYRIFGLHWCLNIVCGPRPGGAVLLRALQPQTGLELMRERRGRVPDRRLCAGPGNLCQALGVGPELNGVSLLDPPFQLSSPLQPQTVVSGPRIGISKAMDRPWRFGLAGSPFLSRPLRVQPGAPTRTARLR